MHLADLLSLKGKVCLVTGGAGLYGRHITEALAEAGGTVVTASRSLEAGQHLADELARRGLAVAALTVDQADHESVMQLKAELEQRHGRLDVFINNAVARPMKRYEDPLAAWAESMRVNATGMFDITREMADLIARGGGGSIVNIASMQGVYAPDFMLYEGTAMDSPPDYHFHKGGLITLTRYLARKLATRNIRVNAVSPGGLLGDQDPQFLGRYNQKVPLGRMALPDDIKGVVVFLASPASAYITGENILMDGGLHA
ncbi:MAG TPA: SDR family oxidoreductase [Candidatus Sumerlaeota bacterium]|nr:MAG: 3-oxoacyl-(acyl-carrier-protein) reductase FabG [candidate division BRC1 bacterium ADurb.BinA292]HOR28862.1 SDR family oxidoreductase [Candidatus Sumerlaeota bacterium]HPK03469.1 SDR family oxidoreductase [Candidatus Sumerlaeota bacterium]